MNADSWKFLATDLMFDGDRIVREAGELNAQVVSVTRDDITVTLATTGFLNRLRKHDLFDINDWLLSVPRAYVPRIHASGNLGTKVTYSRQKPEEFTGRWMNKTSFRDLVARLKEAELPAKPVEVRVWYE